jgi:hypothetical protein
MSNQKEQAERIEVIRIGIGAALDIEVTNEQVIKVLYAIAKSGAIHQDALNFSVEESIKVEKRDAVTGELLETVESHS